MILPKVPTSLDVHVDKYLPFDRVNPETGELETVHYFAIGTTLFVSQACMEELKRKAVTQ